MQGRPWGRGRGEGDPVRVALAVIVALGAILLFLLASASANTAATPSANAKSGTKAGTSANMAADDRMWSVPMGALHDTGKGPGVWLIQGQPAKVTWRPVAVQRLGDDVAFVTGPFKSGERIVALGGPRQR